MNIDEIVSGTLGFALGLFLWIFSVNWTASNYQRIGASCGYTPHPISDIAWEIADREGGGFVGAAWYYTTRVRSSQYDVADCMRKRYQPGWTG